METPNYNFIKSNTTRSCRSETLMRVLTTTSYPKALFTNLCVVFTEIYEQYDLAVIEELSQSFRTIEKEYEMVDFARSMQIRRSDNNIELNLNVLKFDPKIQKIIDGKETAERLVNFKLLVTQEPNEELDVIANMILDGFYRVQKRVKYLRESKETIKWFIEDTEDKNKQHILTYKELKGLITESLIKDTFNILLLQNTLIISDQKFKIYLKGD